MGVLAEFHAQPRIHQPRSEGHIGLQAKVYHRVEFAREFETSTAEHDHIALCQCAIILALPFVTILCIHKSMNLNEIADLPIALLFLLARKRVRLPKSMVQRAKRKHKSKNNAQKHKTRIGHLSYIIHYQNHKTTL